ncbi:MAG TPA: MFS transporter [Candidatus Limnocylindrales bacterium]|jgi:MFS family permease
MSRGTRLIVLASLGLGVFLVGVELMVTAVALPQILESLSDWTQLTHASWIVNGYLVAYVAVMPLAGRAADRYNLATLYGLSLGAFAVGSFVAGTAQSLDWLIAARIVQGAGAGAVFPLATAAAGHLFEGPARARAIGLVGALSFLGMACGPFIGATILQAFVLSGGALVSPSWRWVFYVGAPFALLAGIYTWATARGWPTATGGGSLDVVGAALFTTGVACGLIAITSAGGNDAMVPAALAVVSGVAVIASLVWFRRAKDPFFDLKFFRDRTFSGAIGMALLTGYAFATALIGAAVFIDRVRYAGPSEQQLALGSLALAMAIGALGSGYLVRPMGVMLPSLAGLVAQVSGLLLAATVAPDTPLVVLCAGLALFGLGFGITVTARTTGVLEALGRRAYGVGSASLTVARMLGMAIGVSALTVLGSNRIEALSVVLTDQAARDAVLPPTLQGRPLEDYLVVDALERWAAQQADQILTALFVVAAIVTAIAILPTLAMHNRPGTMSGATDEGADGHTNAVEKASRAGLAI